MRAKFGWGLVWGAVLMTSFATPTRRASAGNCALYARAQTGVDLFGAAGGWWDEAAGRYQRGHVPAVGSILVFRRTGYIPSGHVAVVAQVVNSREIVVDHANWYHGMVTRGVTVIDDSPNNDWSAVAVMDLGTGKYGRDNPTYGFVYPGTGPQRARRKFQHGWLRSLPWRYPGILRAKPAQRPFPFRRRRQLSTRRFSPPPNRGTRNASTRRAGVPGTPYLAHSCSRPGRRRRSVNLSRRRLRDPCRAGP